MKSLEEELLQFPRGKHDDEIDALASQLELLVPGDSQAMEGIPIGFMGSRLSGSQKVQSPL